MKNNKRIVFGVFVLISVLLVVIIMMLNSNFFFFGKNWHFHFFGTLVGLFLTILISYIVYSTIIDSIERTQQIEHNKMMYEKNRQPGAPLSFANMDIVVGAQAELIKTNNKTMHEINKTSNEIWVKIGNAIGGSWRKAGERSKSIIEKMNLKLDSEKKEG